MQVPSHVGRYEVVGEIASGGMASVYLGRATGAAGFERLVAIKICHPHLARDVEFVAMFQDEARLAARIHHPNVIATFDVGQEGDAHFLVMEYVKGERLIDVHLAATQQGGAIPFPILLRILHDALEGLHAAHSLLSANGEPLRVVHRDISPQNLLVGVDGLTRVLDFGVARAEERATVTRDGHVKGKVGYMAPEQLSSQTVDQRADLFALGVVLWELIVNKRLFRGETTNETSQRVLTQPIQPPSALRDDCPASLDAITLRALNRRPEGRFRSAAEFAETLSKCGIPMASTREVATYVGATCADALRTRDRRFAAMLPDAREGRGEEPAREGRGEEPAREGRGEEPPQADATPLGAAEFTREIGTVAATPRALLSPTPTPRERAQTPTRRYAPWIAAALVIVAGLFWWSREGPSSDAPLAVTEAPSAVIQPPSTDSNVPRSQGETPSPPTTSPPPSQPDSPPRPTQPDSPPRPTRTGSPRLSPDETMQPQTVPPPAPEPTGEYMPEEI